MLGAASVVAVTLSAAPSFADTVAEGTNTPSAKQQTAGTASTHATAAATVPDLAKYNLKVPGGLAFAEFKGYEDWAVVAIDHTDDLMKEIVANPVAMAAFRAGIPGNGKPLPDGSKMAKVEWRPKKSLDAPYDIKVPGEVYDVDFMVKDLKRFPDSGGWGYGVFKYDAAAGTYTPATLTHKPPQGNDAKCGFACHTIVREKDYVFTEYAKR
jgi:hypothetical protein